MAFGAKHLPDKFYLENDIRTSLRDKILREVIGNLLIHREFSSAKPARLIIEKDRLFADNASKALKCGQITLDNLSPVSKNPIIAKFFKQMGRADELGSGTRNLYHYTRLYSNADPVLDEGDMFTTMIPLNDVYSVDRESVTKPSPALSEGINEGINEGIKSHLIEALRKTPGLSVPKLAKIIGKSRATVERTLFELVNQEGMVEHRGSKKTGGYYVL